MGRGCPTAPFKQGDARGNADIERPDFTVHGDFDEQVAVARDEFMKAGAFATHDENGGQMELDLVVLLGAVFGKAVDPIAFLLEFFEGLGDVADADDRHMGESTRRGFGGDLGDRGGAAVRQQDGVGASGVGRADDGPKVVGIFDAVEKDEELRGGGEFGELGVALAGGEGDDALVGGGFARAVKSLAGFIANGHVRLFGQVNDQLHLGATRAFSDQNSLDGLAGAERLSDGMDS